MCTSTTIWTFQVKRINILIGFWEYAALHADDQNVDYLFVVIYVYYGVEFGITTLDV